MSVENVAACALLAIVMIAVPIVSAETAEKTTLNFEKVEKGTLPKDFSTALTGGGGPVAWAIVEDSSSTNGPKVLAQESADSTDYRFPLCIYNPLSARDVEVTVKFKAVAGRVDQAGGLAVRVQDKDNYYVVRANALEDNVNLYKVVAGKRSRFAGSSAKVESGTWHTLKLEARGQRFEVSFDGQRLFEAEDDTFTRAGRVALWTKADSVTYFDDLAIEPYDGQAP